MLLTDPAARLPPPREVLRALSDVSDGTNDKAPGAVELRDRLASGALSAEAAVAACLERIAAREEAVGAWAWLDAEHALETARARDVQRRTGRPVGALHGVPVGVKDIVDTRRMPTANGTVLDAGRAPRENAWIVARLEAEGGIVLGKTVTAELAYLHPGGDA